MTTQLALISKGTGLVKIAPAMRHLQARVERARQSYNEKVVRANAEYYAALERALEMAKEEGADPADTQADPAPSAATSVA